MRRLVLVLLLLSLGCIQEGTAPARGHGVAIKAFETDLPEVKTGNQLSVRLQVENEGDADAENVKAWIFNCGDFTNCGSTMDFHTLSKADLKASLPGESKETVWKVSSNTLLSENERVVQDIGVKVAYDYTSGATAEIPVVSEDKYRELERIGKLSSSRVENSLSPVSVRITAPSIVVGTEPFTIKIELEKSSEGFVAGCGGTTGCIDSVTIVPSSGISKVGGGCDDVKPFSLWRSGSASMSCTLKADAKCGSECHPTVKVTAKYRFVTEESASVTIIGTGEAGAAATPSPVTPSLGQAGFSLSPAAAKVGEPITVSGDGFASGADVSIWLEGKILYEYKNGNQITETDATRKLDATPVVGFTQGAVAGSVKADSAGSIKATVKLPFDAVPGNLYIYPVAEGTYPTENDINSIKKPVTLQQVAYIASVSQASLKIGDSAVVKGGGFAANEDNIKVYLAAPGAIKNPPANHIQLDMSASGSGLAGATAGTLKASPGGYVEGTFTLKAGPSSRDYSIYAIGEKVNQAYTTEQALNGRKIISVEFGVAPTDADDDGIDDLSDACPNTPASIPVDSKGCPLIVVSMLGSATCDYKTNGQADIVARIKNSATSKISGILCLVKDSAAPGISYSGVCSTKIFEPGEEFDAKISITALATGTHKVTAAIYLGAKEINSTGGLEFDVPSNDCSRLNIESADTDKNEYTLSEPVTLAVTLKNTGARAIGKLNVSVAWISEDKVLRERDECTLTAVAAGSTATCSLVGDSLSTVAGLYNAQVKVKEIREPADILLAEENTIFFNKV